MPNSNNQNQNFAPVNPFMDPAYMASMQQQQQAPQQPTFEPSEIWINIGQVNPEGYLVSPVKGTPFDGTEAPKFGGQPAKVLHLAMQQIADSLKPGEHKDVALTVRISRKGDGSIQATDKDINKLVATLTK